MIKLNITINGRTLDGIYPGNKFIDTLKAPLELKPFIQNESRLEDGVRVIVPDTPRFASRNLSLEFVIIGDSPRDMYSKRDAFFNELYKGQVELCVTEPVGNEIESIYYHLVYLGKSPTYDQSLTRKSCRVKVSFMEPNPRKHNEIAPYYLYTEDFQDYTDDRDLDDFATEYHYHDFEEMARDYPNAAKFCGSRRFYDTGETIRYQGFTLSLWALQNYENGEWVNQDFYGILRRGQDYDSLVANSMEQDMHNRYEPFIAIADLDKTIYTTTGHDSYCLVYVEMR